MSFPGFESLLVVLSPLLGFVVVSALTLSGKERFARLSGAFASFFMFLSLLFSIGNAFDLFSHPVSERSVRLFLFDFYRFGSLHLSAAFQIDPLSAIMAVVISAISFLVHLYSLDYMRDEEGYSRYFAFLNFFSAMMLFLIFADSLFFLFFGWEGIGAASYLLISHYNRKNSSIQAGYKAFLVNRAADLFFLTGMILLFTVLSDAGPVTFSFDQLRIAAPLLSGRTLFGVGAVDLVALLFFLGTVAKSAQFPLHIWLPDAMAGPTPVSALIHAATLVVAGLYLLLRVNALLIASPFTMELILCTGLFTAFLAATIAPFQFDIKKILAWSTISQLGLMYAGIGSGAFAASFFHLFTHAFFKALLFLSAGSVILASHHEQDLRRLHFSFTDYRFSIPFLVGVASLAGIAPFSGFFSKDELLLHLFVRYRESAMIYPALFLVVSFLTAFYSFRLYFLLFHRGGDGADAHHRNVSTQRWIFPVLLLFSLFAFVGGLFNLPASFDLFRPIDAAVGPLFPAAEPGGDVAGVAWIGSIAALLGVIGAYLISIRNRSVGTMSRFAMLVANGYFIDAAIVSLSTGIARSGSALFFALDAKIDQIVLFSKPLFYFFARMFHKLEWGIDSAILQLTGAIYRTGKLLTRLHTGLIRHYLYYATAGALILSLLSVWL